MRRAVVTLSAGLVLLSTGAGLSQTSRPHNVILFVPDGLRGQIVPAALDKMWNDADPTRAKRVVDTFMTMKKLDIAQLQQAASPQ